MLFVSNVTYIILRIRAGEVEIYFFLGFRLISFCILAFTIGNFVYVGALGDGMNNTSILNVLIAEDVLA